MEISGLTATAAMPFPAGMAPDAAYKPAMSPDGAGMIFNANRSISS